MALHRQQAFCQAFLVNIDQIRDGAAKLLLLDLRDSTVTLAFWKACMHRADHALRNSKRTVSSVAFAWGYESEKSFGKAFKRVKGCAPTLIPDGRLNACSAVIMLRVDFPRRSLACPVNE
jgi:AraC-like DNA-binding protein